jgi:plasmid maintenance system antidote protein VapI
MTESTPVKMSAALLDIRKKIADELNNANRNELMSRYAAGKLIAEALTDRRKYGENAAELLANSLGLSATFLYNLQNLYNQWKEDYSTFRELISQSSKTTNMSLTYSHFVLLNSIPTSKERINMAKLVLRDGLSYDQLKTLICGQYGKRSNNRKVTTPKTPLASAVVLGRSLAKLADSHNKVQAYFASSWGNIQESPKEFGDEETIKTVRKLIKGIKRAKEHLAEDEARLLEFLKLLPSDTHVRTDSLEKSGAPKQQVTASSSKANAVAKKAPSQQPAKTATKVQGSPSAVIARIKAAQAARNNPHVPEFRPRNV